MKLLWLLWPLTLEEDPFKAQEKLAELKAKAMAEADNKTFLDSKFQLEQDQALKLEVKAMNCKSDIDLIKATQLKIDAGLSKIKNNSFGPGETKDSVQFQITCSAYQESELSKAQDNLLKDNLEFFKCAEESKKSDFSEMLFDFINNYQAYLATITLDQKVAIMNLIGLYTIFSTTISILMILLGNEIILWLNLEIKYPKLAKFLRVRAKVSQFVLKLHFVLYFFTLLLYAGLNLYILFWRG